MAAKSERQKPESTTTRAGRCVVYDKTGREIWRQDRFVCGVDQVPRALSMVMGAMLVVSEDGERVAGWNPWGVL
jgi:hypothetical protein